MCASRLCNANCVRFSRSPKLHVLLGGIFHIISCFTRNCKLPTAICSFMPSLLFCRCPKWPSSQILERSCLQLSTSLPPPLVWWQETKLRQTTCHFPRRSLSFKPSQPASLWRPMQKCLGCRRSCASSGCRWRCCLLPCCSPACSRSCTALFPPSWYSATWRRSAPRWLSILSGVYVQSSSTTPLTQSWFCINFVGNSLREICWIDGILFDLIDALTIPPPRFCTNFFPSWLDDAASK